MTDFARPSDEGRETDNASRLETTEVETDTDVTGNSDVTGDSDADDAVANGAVLDDLFAVIEDRRDTLPEGSYTASLFTHEKGENRVLEKLGEETTETILAAKDDDTEEITAEAADLVYHLLVLLAMKEVSLSDLRRELRTRR